jgi:fibronectin type 3 domain-containing protein
VALSGTGMHDVILTWTASSTYGLAGYNVYRGTTSGGESTTPLNSAPVTGTTYDDMNVQAGQKYYYKITAVSLNETTQSGDSNEVSATVPSS